MNLFKLVVQNIRGSAFRSWVVTLCAFLVAGFTLATTLLLNGTQNSVRLALNRLGADIVVVPTGSEAEAESALLMAVTTRIWMPEANLARVAAIPGVQVASPQLYLSSMTDAPCCSVSNMFLVAYDPGTDFTIQPWLIEHFGGGLGERETVGGTYIFTPIGEQYIYMYGYTLTLKANLEPTGSGLDQSMFVTFATAREIARMSSTLAIAPLEIPEGMISAIFVKLAPGYDLRSVAADIMKTVPGVTPIQSSELFQGYRQQMNGIRKGLLLVLGIIWILSLLLVGLVFSMAVNERRRELGVLRAMGASRRFVFSTLLSEVVILALWGGIMGSALTIGIVLLFRKLLIATMNLPFIFPTLPVLLSQVGIGLGVALVSVAVATLIPAYRVSHQDPAAAMRE
ncbi:MAG: ABC transporter permease [Anaerolineae bacterium]